MSRNLVQMPNVPNIAYHRRHPISTQKVFKKITDSLLNLPKKKWKFKFQIAQTNRRELSDKDMQEMEDILDRISTKSQKDGDLTPLDMFRK
jgi:hypothetical protein